MTLLFQNSNSKSFLQNSKKILRAPFIDPLHETFDDARSLLRPGAVCGPSNHRGDTERGALSSGTRGRSTVSGTDWGHGPGNWGLMGLRREGRWLINRVII